MIVIKWSRLRRVYKNIYGMGSKKYKIKKSKKKNSNKWEMLSRSRSVLDPFNGRSYAIFRHRFEFKFGSRSANERSRRSVKRPHFLEGKKMKKSIVISSHTI